MEKIEHVRRAHDSLKSRERETMKRAILLPVLILLFSTSLVWARKNPPRPFLLQEVVILNGAQVPPGIYQLAWETQGSEVYVTLGKDGQVVAAAHGVWVKNGEKYAEDAALLRVNSDGSKSLIEIRIAGGAKAIVFDHTNAAVHYTALP